MLQNLRPSVITRSFEITRMIRLNNTLVTYCGADFTLLFEYPYFFCGFLADKNSAANSAIGGGLE